MRKDDVQSMLQALRNRLLGLTSTSNDHTSARQQAAAAAKQARSPLKTAGSWDC